MEIVERLPNEIKEIIKDYVHKSYFPEINLRKNKYPEGLTTKLKFDVDRFKYLHENHRSQLFKELAEQDILYFPSKSDLYCNTCGNYYAHVKDKFFGLYNIKSGPGYYFDLCHITEPRITFSAREELFVEPTWHLDYKRRNFKVNGEYIEEAEKTKFTWFVDYDCHAYDYVVSVIAWEKNIYDHKLKLIKQTKYYDLFLMFNMEDKTISGYVIEYSPHFEYCAYGLEEELHSDDGVYEMMLNFYGKDNRNLVMTRGQNDFAWKRQLIRDGVYKKKLKRICLPRSDSDDSDDSDDSNVDSEYQIALTHKKEDAMLDGSTITVTAKKAVILKKN